MIQYTTNNIRIDENEYEEITLQMSYIEAFGSILKAYNEGDVEQYAVNLIGNTQKALAECVLYKLFPKIKRDEDKKLTLEDIIDREFEVLLDFADILTHLGGHKPNQVVNEIGDVMTHF